MCEEKLPQAVYRTAFIQCHVWVSACTIWNAHKYSTMEGKKADRHITDTEVTTSHMTTWFHWSDNAHRQDNRRSSAPSRGSSSDHETSETTKASGDLSGRFTTQSSRTKGLKQNTNTCIFINTITCGAYFEFDLVNSSNKVLTSAVRYGPNFISR